MTLEKFKQDFLSFDGRINRWPYFWKTTVVGIVIAVPFMLSLLLLPNFGANIIVTLLSIFNFIIDLSFGIRRCHDIGISGWWLLLTIVPFVNFLFIFYLLFKAGTPGPNQYGPAPTRESY